MKLVNIKTLIYIGDPKDLLKCKLCHKTDPQYIAVENNWVKDVDIKNTYYCPDCESFLINDVDNPTD